MNRKTILLSVIFLAVTASAHAQDASAPAPAAGVRPGSDQTTASPDQSAAPPAEATTHGDIPKAGRIGSPPPGKGQVVFFRPSRFAGMALSFSVHEGDKGVGKLGNGSYFVLAADPGPHSYSIQSEAKDTLNLEVEAGETQYVMETLGMGVMMARPHLTPSDQAAFEKLDLKESAKAASDLKPHA